MNNTHNVKLISSDNFYYEIPEEVAIQSKVLKTLLNTNYPFVEGTERTFSLPITALRLERVIEYLRYKEKYSNVENEDIPDFPITSDEALDLLEISAYLKI